MDASISYNFNLLCTGTDGWMDRRTDGQTQSYIQCRFPLYLTSPRRVGGGIFRGRRVFLNKFVLILQKWAES